MSILKQPVLFVGSRGERTLNTLFDPITNLSCIHPDLVTNLGPSRQLGRRRPMITTISGQYTNITEGIVLDFYINDILLSDEFLLVPGLGEECIIGDATRRKWRIKLDLNLRQVTVSPTAAKLRI